jgi:hypothetical protein
LKVSANARIAYWPCDLRFPGAIAQLEEHLLCKQGVRGSSPLSSTHLTRKNSPPLSLGGFLLPNLVALLVALWLEWVMVGGTSEGRQEAAG